MNQYLSRFGGLWIDQADRALVERRIAAIPHAELRREVSDFNRCGYVILRGAVDPALIDAYLREVAAAGARPGCLLMNAPGHARPTEPFDPARSLLPGTKVLDTAALCASGPALCFAPRVARFLQALFGETALAFQTLHFEMGSQQGIHQDTAYVVVAEQPMHLIASWTALEDVQPGTGELTFLVGGHRLPEHVYSGAFKHFDIARDGAEQHDAHYRKLHAEAARRGLTQRTFLGRKGDVLLWHADLPHGGSAIAEPGRTRRSLVTHFCPGSCMPHYFQFVAEARRRKVAAEAGALASMYYDPADFFSVAALPPAA
jgi:hypothetical protein